MTCSFVFTPKARLEPTTYQLAVPSYYRYRDITSTAAPKTPHFISHCERFGVFAVNSRFGCSMNGIGSGLA